MLSQAIVTCFLEIPVGLQPRLERLERLGPQPVDSPLGRRVHLDQPSVTQHAEVFGDLWLAELELRGNLTHRARALAQEFDNPEAVRLGQGAQRREHAFLVQVYIFGVGPPWPGKACGFRHAPPANGGADRTRSISAPCRWRGLAAEPSSTFARLALWRLPSGEAGHWPLSHPPRKRPMEPLSEVGEEDSLWSRRGVKEGTLDCGSSPNARRKDWPNASKRSIRQQPPDGRAEFDDGEGLGEELVG